jgi:hypothetical protein
LPFGFVAVLPPKQVCLIGSLAYIAGSLNKNSMEPVNIYDNDGEILNILIKLPPSPHPPFNGRTILQVLDSYKDRDTSCVLPTPEGIYVVCKYTKPGDEGFRMWYSSLENAKYLAKYFELISPEAFTENHLDSIRQGVALAMKVMLT